MPDMLVKLYEVQEDNELINELKEEGIEIRNAIAPEKHIVVDWVRKKFSDFWASETEVAFANQPVSCVIAIKDNQILGFACYEATCKDYFGPTGVHPDYRGKGIGKALLLRSLMKLKDLGYGYAIIGGAGPEKFYEITCGATAIENSVPGIYKGMLKLLK